MSRMVRQQLDARQWAKVAAFLESERGAGRPAKNNRNFIEAVLWWAPLKPNGRAVARSARRLRAVEDGVQSV
jgi:hypothetical protein